MNKEMWITGTIVIIIGMILCCGDITGLGILLIIVGLIMLFISICSLVLKKYSNDNLKKDNEVKCVNEDDEDSEDNEYDEEDECGEEQEESYDNFKKDNEEENNVEYESYVKVKFYESSKVYTYISNPGKRLYAGEMVDILSGDEICQVKVVQSDTREIKKTDMKYKMIRFPLPSDRYKNYRTYDGVYDYYKSQDDWY